MTADELDALARRLGAEGFPGVGTSVFDEVPAALHARLTARFLATLAARDLVAERAGDLVAPAWVSLLLGPELRGATRFSVERSTPEGSATIGLGNADGAVVGHRADGDLHRFDLLATDGEVAPVLTALVDASPARDAGPDGGDAGPDGATAAPAGTAGRTTPAQDPGAAFSAPHSAILAADQVPAAFRAAADGWRAATTVVRAGSAGDRASTSWLAVLDGGPGRVWLVEPDPASPDGGLLDDDPLLAARPVGPDALAAHLSVWVADAPGG